MSWDEKDWAYTKVYGDIEKVNEALKKLDQFGMLSENQCDKKTESGRCIASYYLRSNYVSELSEKEKIIYNKVAKRYNVTISYQYLDYPNDHFPNTNIIEVDSISLDEPPSSFFPLQPTKINKK